MSDSKSGANWVEVSTLVLVLVGVVGSAAKFIWFDMPIAELDRRQRAVEVKRSEAEIVSVSGQILSPDVLMANGERSVPICPVIVTITNAGQTPVALESIDFRVFVGTLRNVSNVSPLDIPVEPITLVDGTSNRHTSEQPEETFIGVIEHDSPNWKKLIEKANPIRQTILPGQTHRQRFHLIAPTASNSLLTKADVIVRTKKSEYNWYGFANPRMVMETSSTTYNLIDPTSSDRYSPTTTPVPGRSSGPIFDPE